MTKIFDFMKRSSELIAQGVSDEEAVAIMDKERSDADYEVLDDGSFFGLADKWAEEAEREYQESLKSE